MHTICDLQEVSRHRTSEGLVSYHRCRCGRLEVRRSGVAVLSSAGGTPAASDRAVAAPPGGSRATGFVDGAGALVGGVLVVAAATAVPPAALVVAVGLGLFVGVMTGIGAGFVAADPRRGLRVAVGTTAAATPVVVAGAGLVAALGSASVIALPGLYAVAGAVWWVRRRSVGSARAT